MTITTFAVLIDKPQSNKVVLVDLRPGEQLSGFALTAGQTNTYEISYLYETITLANSKTELLPKEIEVVEEDGVVLTERTSIAIVEANAGSWWHDTANSKFYIHTVGSDVPDNHTVVGFFFIYLGTESKRFSGKSPYKPYISSNGIPSISQSTPSIHWGTSQISVGKLIANNERGFFDQIAKKFIWQNAIVILRVGGESLPFSEYQSVFTGKVKKVSFSRRDFEFDLTSNAFDLLRQLPINSYWTGNYPNLDPAAVGKPIPYGYGSYTANNAPEATCINIAYAADTYQFKICDNAIGSITQVYINYDGGLGWSVIAHANENLTNATFTIVAAAFIVGTSKVKVAFEGKQSGGANIEKAPYIVEDILINLCGYTSSQLNTTSFTASKALSVASLNVWIKDKIAAISIIERICQSDLAFFDEDGSGLLRYRTYNPAIDLSATRIKENTDMIGDSIPQIEMDISNLYYKVRVGYFFDPLNEVYLYVEESDDSSKYRNKKSDELIIETYLRNYSDANILAQRMNLIMKEISPIVSFKSKMKLVQKNLGDQVKLVMPRAPFESAGGYNDRYFEIFEISKSCFPLLMDIRARDVMEYGFEIGHWASATAPVYASATEEEKSQSGFWSDASGYVVPGDISTKNISKWW